MLPAPDIPSHWSLSVNKRKGSANYTRQSRTAASQLGGVSVWSWSWWRLALPPPPPPRPPIPFYSQGLPGWRPGPDFRTGQQMLPYRQVPPTSSLGLKSKDPRLRWYPAPCLKVGGRGRGGPYGWTLQLTQEVRGEPGTRLGSAPPAAPRLCCLRRTMKCFQVC